MVFLRALLIVLLASGAAMVHKLAVGTVTVDAGAKPLPADMQIGGSRSGERDESRGARPAETIPAEAGEAAAATPDEGADSPEEASADAGSDAAEGPWLIGLDRAVEIYELALSGEGWVIDARAPDKYREGHILGAMNLTPAAFRDDATIRRVQMYVPKNAPLMIYCLGEDCDESENVAIRLEAMGYDPSDIYIYTGGWPEWSKRRPNDIETGPDPWQ